MSVLSTVIELKESLAKELPLEKDEESSVERCKDILSRLDECQVTLSILTESLIGTVVSKLKAHDQLGPTAKALVKKWKKVAKENNNEAKDTKKQPASPAPAGTAKKKKPAAVKRRESLPSETNVDAASNWEGLPEHRMSICKKFYDLLVMAKPALLKMGINGEAIDHLTGPRAAEIEAALQKSFRDKKAYIEKARSLAFNLKKNKELSQEVILGSTDAESLVKMTTEQLASAETRQARTAEAKKLVDSKRLDWEQANEDKINEMCGIKGELLKASLFTCGRCKSTKTTSTQKQTRSADEPMTVFVLCMNCGKRWKC